MPDVAPSKMADSESRTASVGRHASAGATAIATALAPSTSTSSLHSSTSSPRSTSSRKRKRGKKRSADGKDFVPMGANFSKSSELLQPTTSNPTNADTHTSPSEPVHDNAIESSRMETSTSNIGNNRLATGFKPSKPSARTSAVDMSRNHSNSSHDTSGGASKDDAIEISSDEEMEDSEGGMIVNVHENVPDLTNGSISEDEGLVTTSDDGDILQVHEDLTRSADVADSSNATSGNLRLLDLNPDELEEQLKYAFYHLNRTQVDLNRPVTCLLCLRSGHLSSDCHQATCKQCGEDGNHPSSLCPTHSRCTKCRERGHRSQDCQTDLKVTTVPCDVCGRLSHVEQDCPEQYFLPTMLEGPLKLWISCCICSSKSHLVGDCPDAPTSASTSRWSLKSLDPCQFTNMSLQPATRKLEQDAETRGMRPVGMQIRGRAGLHHAGVSKSAPVSDDEADFLRPAVGRNNLPPKPQVRLGDYDMRRPSPPRRGTSDRYDRFEARSFDPRGQNRGRGGWYATDSFGRRRSRSPGPDNWRPGSRTSPSPRRFDGYQQSDRAYRGPPPSDYWRPSQNNLPPSPPPSNRNTGPNMAAPSRPVQLPTRKGSNPNLLSKPPNTAQSLRKNQAANAAGGRKNKKKGGGVGQADSEVSDVGDDFSVLGALIAEDLQIASGGFICLDLPDNLQAWLDKLNVKRKLKGQKSLFVSEVADDPRPSKMTLFDAQTGQTVKVNANDCNNIASKGFKLLGKSKKMDTATQDSQKEHQKQSNPTTLSQQAAKVGEGQQVQVVANVTHRYFLRPRRAGAVVSSISTDQPWGSKDNDTMKITDPHGAIPDVGQPKAVLNPAPTAPVLSGLKTCTRSANSNKPKTELGDWLELENDLRRAQGKGPISIKRAGTEDALGCYIHSWLVDAATGAYKAVSADRYGEMRKIDHLFHLQKKANNAQDGQLTELERYMSHMRGQALPQSPPPEFVATMRNAMRKAASEGRQLILSNLQLDFTAVDIDRFFDGFEVETIAIAFDSITELPTGFANIDFHTPVDAQLAVQYLHGKDLKGKKVTLIFSSFYHPDHDVDVAGSHTKLAVSAHQRVDLNDKPMADVQGALVEVRSVRGSITETGSTKEQLGAPPDDIDTDLEEARSRAKNGQGNMKLHLQKLEAYMKMANQERSLFGLPPLRRLPGGRMVSIKKTYIFDPVTNAKTHLNTRYRQMVNAWWKDGNGKMEEARAEARDDARAVWKQIGSPITPGLSAGRNVT